MAANVFKSGKMISNVVDSYLANAVSDVVIPDGAIVALGELAADTTYSATGKEYDTYVAAAPAAVEEEVVEEEEEEEEEENSEETAAAGLGALFG